MLITCPQCHTSYDVPAPLEKTAQRVKCVKCDCIWEIEPDDIEIDQEQSAPDELSPLPDVDLSFAPPPHADPQEQDIPPSTFQDIFKEPEKKPASFQKWIRPLYFLSLFCIAASIYLLFFHLPARPKVTIQTLSYEFTEENYKPYLFLQALVFNTTDKAIGLKTFSVRFFDANDRTLTTTTLPSPLAQLPAGGTEKIDFKIERPPSQAVKAVLTLTK